MSKMLKTRHLSLFFVLTLFGFFGKTSFAQKTFVCDNTLYQTIKNGGTNSYQFYEIETFPNLTVNFNLLRDLGLLTGSLGINALAYNPVDNYIYGVSAENSAAPYYLTRIDADYNATYVGTITGIASGTVLGGTIDLNGNFYITTHTGVVGGGTLYSVNINTLTATSVMTYNDYITDFAIDPFTGRMYGVDVDGYVTSEPNALKEIDPIARTVTIVGNTPVAYGSVASMFFNSKGDLFGYAVDANTAAAGAEVLVKIDKNTAGFTVLGRDVVSAYSDGCSCAFGFEMDKESNLEEVPGGGIVEYTITIYNASGQDASNVAFNDDLRYGLTFASEPYGETNGLTINSPGIVGGSTGSLTLTNVPDGTSSFRVQVQIPTNYAGPEIYPNQAGLSDLPIGHPDLVPSDDPSTPAIDDSTRICIELDDLEYGDGTFCRTGVDPDPTIYGPVGGTFTVSPSNGLAISSDGTIDLSESDEGTYTITYTTTGECGGTANTQVTIYDDNSAGTPNDETICITETNFDLNSTLTGALSGGTWKDDDNTGALSGSGNGFLDASEAGVDMSDGYDFTYVVQNGPCIDSTTVNIRIADTVFAGTVLNDGVFELCDDIDDFNLFDLLNNDWQSGGGWIDDDGSGGLFDAYKFDATVVALDQVYHFTYYVQADAPCPDASVTVEIRVVEDPFAGDSAGTAVLCNVGDPSIDLDDLVFPATTGGNVTWLIIDSPSHPISGTFGSDNGYFKATGNEPGTYHFRKVVENCGQEDFIDVYVTVEEGRDADGDGLNNHYEGQLSDRDTDDDGILDYLDMDSDNDGIPDAEEAGQQNDPCEADARDVDGDGVADYLDLDSDGDGIFDLIESGTDGDEYDKNNDGVIDENIDVGDNGLADDLETSDDSGESKDDPVDSDDDGIADHLDLDSDNDGITDIEESGGSGDDDGDGVIDDLTDIDGDGVADVQDNTDGHGNEDGDNSVDTDGDGLSDHADLDSDNDGIADIIESGGEDDDNDGMVDDMEDDNGDGLEDDPDKVVTNPTDTDGDGDPDHLDLDSDNDGIKDIVEVGGDDDNNDGMIDDNDFNDSNNDGMDDDDMVSDLSDFDGDGVSDVHDLDSDNDGIADIVESGNGDLDDNNDGLLDDPDADTDAPLDTDGDGQNNNVDLDSDDDSISDIIESGNTDALENDQNNDGMIDDTTDEDGDGIADVIDGNTDGSGGLDNSDLTNTDGDYTDGNGDDDPDYIDKDSDGDGLFDIDEVGNGHLDEDDNGVIDDPQDSDNDGIHDAVDSNPNGTGGAENNTEDIDGDGVYDHMDIEIDDPVIPQGFSPNGDGVNDVLVITNLGPFDQSTLKIYNRWGNIVYKSHAYRNDWDGNYNRHAAKYQAEEGTKVPAGTYYYIFEQGSTVNVAGDYADMPDKVKTGYIYISY